jgi:hypothetical protein
MFPIFCDDISQRRREGEYTAWIVLREPNRFAHLFAIILREHNPCHSCLRLTRAKPLNALMGLIHEREILTRNNFERF